MKEELKAAFLSYKFVAAFLLYLFCLFINSIPQWIGSYADFMDGYHSVVELVLGALSFGGANMIFPLCAAAPHATSQVDELRTGYYYWKGIRGSTIGYALRKAAAAGLSGAAAVGGAFLLHAAFWSLIAPAYDPTNESMVIYLREGGIWANTLSTGNTCGLFLYISATLAYIAMVWAVMGLAVGTWIPDPLLVITIPVVTYFMWIRGLFERMGIFLKRPSIMYTEAGTMADAAAAAMTCGIIVLVCFLLYYVGMRRRLQRG